MLVVVGEHVLDLFAAEAHVGLEFVEVGDAVVVGATRCAFKMMVFRERKL